MKLRCYIILHAIALSSPAFAQEREWSLDTNADREVFMTYGVPQTEDVGLSLWCKIGSGEIRLFVPKSGWAPKSAPQKVKVKLAANHVRTRIPANLEADVASGSLSIEARIPMKDPIVNALVETDHFDVDTGKRKLIVPMYEAETESLLRLCAKK